MAERSDPATLIFYHAPQTRGAIVRWLLEEIGRPYEVRRLDLERGEHKQPAYLAINPMGKVPALVDGAAVITEVAAICCHLADAFPDAGLAVPIGDRRRGPYLRWLFFAAGCVEPAILDRMLERPPGPASAVGYGDFDSVLEVIARAVDPGPYLLGGQFTAADLLLGSQLRWGMMMDVVPRRPEIASYVERLAERPALGRATAKDAELVAAPGR